MKLITRMMICAVALTALAGCAVTNNKSSIHLVAPVAQQISATSRQYGGVTVTTNQQGVWTEIASMESVIIGLDGGRDLQKAAFHVALSYAKQNIVVFVSSSVGYNTIVRPPRDRNDRRTNEAIYDHSSAILRGVVIDQMWIEGDRAYVRVVVRRADIAALN